MNYIFVGYGYNLPTSFLTKRFVLEFMRTGIDIDGQRGKGANDT